MTSQPADGDEKTAGPTVYRDVAVPAEATPDEVGKKYVAVIGIDHYRAWARLHNAVNDARGALRAFENLGFESVCPPLVDEAATGIAIRQLVSDRLRQLTTNDSLVVFFAGHGRTESSFAGGAQVNTGYLIPVDAQHPGGSPTTWLEAEGWIKEISRLPPKHILVILDACHSGIALGNSVIHFRGPDTQPSEPLERLRTRRSRRIITSALHDEQAMDGGPIHGHSLFTGCLIEALRGRVFTSVGRPNATATEIASFVRSTVIGFSDAKQTPDSGVLYLHDHGDLVIERYANVASPDTRVHTGPTGPHEVHSGRYKDDAGRHPTDFKLHSTTSDLPAGPDEVRSRVWLEKLQKGVTDRSEPPSATPSSMDARAVLEPSYRDRVRVEDAIVEPRQDRNASIAPSTLDAAFVASLDRHQAERHRGRAVLSIVEGDSMTTLTGWAMWAARQGRLTLVTEGNNLDDTIADLLAQLPWLRMVSEARAWLALASGLDGTAINIALSQRGVTRDAWIADVSRSVPRARVADWILQAVRDPLGPPELSTAPVQGSDLLSILGKSGLPFAILLHCPGSPGQWIERALQTATELVRQLPHLPIAIGASKDEIARGLLGAAETPSMKMIRHSVVPLATRLPVAPPLSTRCDRVLHEALSRNHRTACLFELNATIPIYGEQAVEVDLAIRPALLAIEIDDWYRSRDPHAYRRERTKDVSLRRAGFFVMRYLADDVDLRLEHIVNEIATVVDERRTTGSFS